MPQHDATNDQFASLPTADRVFGMDSRIGGETPVHPKKLAVLVVSCEPVSAEIP
jgi:hypothetical protein